MAAAMKLVTSISAVCLALFSIGIHDFVMNYDDNKCEMTYMYQLPQYIKVPLNETIVRKFPLYGLYLYGEGEYADKIRNLQLNGIPVLFIPGNAGSYKQVRSAASIALRKAEFSGTKYHFNYFSVDLNEELSGLFGGVLQSQTEFVSHCIWRILHLYPKNSPQENVVIIGHSMGGLIARALFTLPDFNVHHIHTIITLATPHLAPVISFDSSLQLFYEKINDCWTAEFNKTLNHVTMVSIGGGYQDILVRQELTSISQLISSERIISASSLSVPRVWLSTDHLCIVWCKQLVLVTQRALFDLVNATAKQLTLDVSHRMKIFQKYFIEPDPKSLKKLLDTEPLSLYHHGETVVKTELQWNFFKDKVMKPIYLFIPLPKADVIAARVSVQLKEGIFACQDEVCQNRVEITSQAVMFPSTAEPERILQINVRDLQITSEQLAVYIPRTMNKVSIMADMYNISDRHLNFSVPFMFNPSIKLLLNSTAHQAIFYKIHLQDFENVWQVFTLTVFKDKYEKCFDETVPPVVKLFTPWSSQEVFYILRSKLNDSIPLKLQVPKPPGFQGDAELHFILNPCSSYHAEVKPDIKQALGQVIRFYSAWLPALILAYILIPLAKQLTKISNCESPQSFIYELTHYTYQDCILISLSIVIKSCIRSLDIHGVFSSFIPSWNFTVFQVYILIFFCFVARLIVQLLAQMVLILISIYAIILTKIRKRFTTYFVSTSMGKFQWKPVAIIGLVISVLLGFGICGAAVSALAFIIFTCKVCVLQSNLRLGLHTPQNRDEERFLLHFTLLLLWLFMLMVKLPTLMVWIKTNPFQKSLPEDPSLKSAVMVLSSLPVLFQEHVWKEFPSTSIYLTARCSYLIAACSIIFCMDFLYNSTFLIGCVFLLVAGQQLFSFRGHFTS